jgi:hypothetical protein
MEIIDCSEIVRLSVLRAFSRVLGRKVTEQHIGNIVIQ